MIWTKIRSDATVAENVFASARSKAMRYLRKVHRVSIHFVHDVLQIEGISYEHVDTKINCSDLITKPLLKIILSQQCTFMGLLILDESGTVLALAAAIRSNKRSKANTRRVWFGPTCPSSIGHMLLHLPMSADCEICQLAKISVTPARRTDGSDRATEFGIRFYLDLIGPVVPDFSGNIQLLVGLDESTDYALVAAMLNKVGTTMTKHFKAVTSGATIKKVRPTGARNFRDRLRPIVKGPI